MIRAKSRRPDTSGPKTAAQCKRIWAQAREQGLDEELLHDLVYGVTGLGSIAALTRDQAARVIGELERLAGRPARPRRRARHPRAAGVEYLVTPEQQALLEALKGQIPWRLEDGYERLCRKVIKRDRPTTVREAQMVIEALKGWAARAAR